MSRILTAGALAAAAVLFAAPSRAAIIATLTFDTPSATVLSNEAIEVWVTLHMDAMSDAITTDEFGEVTSGLTDEMITDAGFDPDQIVRTNVNNFFECSGTFTTGGCLSGPNYSFDFNFDPPSFVGAANLNLLPGSDTSFHFGTFNPVGGAAAPGLYSFYNVGFIFQFSQPDPDHPGENRVGSFTFAQTCPSQNDACAFTREVLAAPGSVPEPASWALMILGFGGAGAALRRRRVATVA